MLWAFPDCGSSIRIFPGLNIPYRAGEKRHLTFEDQTYGPDFIPVAELILQYNCSPTIICESAGTQAEDAKTMLDIYNSKREEMK